LLFDIVPKLDQTVIRCYNILKQENVKIESEKDLANFVKENFPDIRRMINDLQKFSISGSLKIKKNDQVKRYAQTILDSLIKKQDVIEIRKYIIQEERNFASDYQMLLIELFDLIYESNIKDDHKKAAMLEIGEHLYRDNFVMDHEINGFCCILNLSKII
jgi:hypothetical protein